MVNRSITITSCCGTGSPEVHRKGHRAIGAAPRGAAAALPAAQERHLRGTGTRQCNGVPTTGSWKNAGFMLGNSGKPWEK